MDAGNLFATFPGNLADEQFTRLLTTPHRAHRAHRLDRTGEPARLLVRPGRGRMGACVLAGSAGLLIEGEPRRVSLAPGDYLHIPAHTRHRVEWTDVEAADRVARRASFS